MIDVLAHYDESAIASFTVNTGATSVALSVPVGDVGILWDADHKSWFQFLEHFTLISLGFKMPLGFEFYNVKDNSGDENLPAIQMAVKEQGAGSVKLLTPGLLYIPFDNYELNYGRFFEMDTSLIAANRYQLVFNFVQGWTYNVSMINVPAALNTVTFYVPIFAKIEHTLDIKVNP